MSMMIYILLSNQLSNGIFLASLIFISAVCVLIYLYKISDFFSKTKFKTFLYSAISLYILAIALLWIFLQPIKQPNRFAIFPIDTSSCAEADRWIGAAITDLIANAIERAPSSDLVIIPADWLQPTIEPDSIRSESYLKSMSHRLRIEYSFGGRLICSEGAYFLDYKFFSANKISDSARIIINCNSDKFGVDIAKIFESYPKLSVKNERVTQNPNTISWKNYILGKMVLHKRSFSEAKDYFELAIQSDSSNIYARTSLAAMYLELGFKAEKEGKSPAPSFSLADKYLKSVQKLDSSDTQNYQCYAKYYILTQKWNQAEAQLRNIIDKNPYNPYAYFYLTQLHSSRYQDLGFRNEEELLQHALNLFPGFVEAAISLSDYYYNYLQDHEKALGVLERMLQINPNQVDLLMNIGKLYISANKVLPALDIFRKIIELQPANSNAYYNLGILYYNTEEYEAALKLFERAIKIDNHLDSHLYIAYIFEKFYQATEDSSKRTDYYNQAIKYLRLRIRYRKGQDDQYAETARKHLAYLLQ